MGFLIDLLGGLLQKLYSFTGNWGWAVVLMTATIKAVLFPFDLMQYRSQSKIKKLQPKIQFLRQVYADDPQKLNAEIMKLYREEKVNPGLGCLVMLLQFPILISLYRIFISWDFGGSGFLFVKDLGKFDPKMVAVAAVASLLSVLPTYAFADPVEKRSMLISLGIGPAITLMFGYMYRLPAGLLLYWAMFSLFTGIEQVVADLFIYRQPQQGGRKYEAESNRGGSNPSGGSEGGSG